MDALTKTSSVGDLALALLDALRGRGGRDFRLAALALGSIASSALGSIALGSIASASLNDSTMKKLALLTGG